MSMLITGIDTTILTVALPSIRQDLDASVVGAQWAIDAYVLVIACSLLMAGSMADRVGRRRVFRIGLLLFTAASLLCSLAPSLGWLVAFRMVQGVGASMLNPVALSIIASVYVEPAERARAIGIWGGIAGISIAAGPLIGGALIETVGWRSVFWINVPVGLLAFALATRYVPESTAPRPRRQDPLGQILVVGILGFLIFAIIEAPSHGWGSVEILASLGVAAACLAAFLAYERVREEPLVDLRFFRSPPFSGAFVISVCTFAALGGFLFLSTLYLQEVRGFSPLHTGVVLLPMAVAMMVFGIVSGRSIAVRGPRTSLLLGGVGVLVAGALSVASGPEPSGLELLLAYVLLGTGMGWMNPAITTIAVAGMPLEQAGLVAGIASTTRQFGLALGVAVVGSVIASQVEVAGSGDFAAAADAGWAIIGAFGFVALCVGLGTSGVWGRRVAACNRSQMELEESPEEAASAI